MYFRNVKIKALANRFSSFFESKIESLRMRLDDVEILPYNKQWTNGSCTSSLSDFKLLSILEVRDLLRTSKTKSCLLDPIPTSVSKQCLVSLTEHIIRIFKVTQGSFPYDLKLAMILPSIKKNSLTPMNFQA